jgi:hypothetical protein
MATIIRIKRSDVSGNPAVLSTGELAYSALADNGSNGGDRLYIGQGIETAGNAANHLVIGGKYFVDQVNSATATNTSGAIVRRDGSGNFTASTITAALIGNASSASILQTARSISLGGAVTGSAAFDGSGNITITATNSANGVALGPQTSGNYVATAVGTANQISVSGSGSATANITLALAALAASPAGTYGSSTAIPIVTVDVYGRVTNVSTTPLTSSFTVAGGSGSTVVTLGSTLTLTGGSGISTSVGSGVATITNTGVTSLAGTTNQIIVSTSTGAITLTLPQNIHTAATPTFAGETLTGTLNMSGNAIQNLLDPVNPQDAATKSYVDAARSGLNVKTAVRVSTISNIALTGTQTIDGIAVIVGDRVLVNAQTDQTQNGIYSVASGAWTRTTDANTGANLGAGTFVFVTDGATYRDQGFVQATTGTITLGTTAISFTQFSGTGEIVAGNGLTKTTSTLAVGAGNGISVSPGSVSLATTVAGTGLSYVAGVLNVGGTANRITVAGTSVDIAATYAGQSSITSLGTISSGIWSGTVISPTYGGTGVNNGGKTITLGGNLASTGGDLSFTLAANTSLTLPTSGTLVNSAVTTLANLVSVGTITTGTWNATPIGSTYGGTGQSVYAIGDILVATSTTTLSRLPVNTTSGKVLQSNGTTVVYGDVDGGTF